MAERLSDDAVAVAACLSPKVGQPVHLIAQDAFGKADACTKHRVKEALEEIHIAYGLDIDFWNQRHAGWQRLYSACPRTWPQMQQVLRKRMQDAPFDVDSSTDSSAE